MADIPAAGYDNPSQDAAVLLTKFKQDYDQLLSSLQSAWEKGGAAGGQDDLATAENSMRALRKSATGLMQIAIDKSDETKGTYGPVFRVA
jgi:hypothetical protein